MVYQNFEQLAERCKARPERRSMAVVCANSTHTLEAVLRAWREELVKPLLIGPKVETEKMLKEMGCREQLPIMDAQGPEQAVMIAVDLVRKGLVQSLFKGMLDTAVLMRSIVDKDNGLLEPGGVMSHITMLEIPGYHKMVGLTDGALLTYPTLEQKRAAVQNAVDYLASVDFENIKVAALAAVEKPNPKMPETLDAHELKNMSIDGRITGCYVEGPISYDLAMKPSAAADKGYDSPVAGNADLLLVPNITAGNILVKSLTCSARAKGAGLVLGARVPVILTSRSTDSAGKYRSIVLSAAI